MDQMTTELDQVQIGQTTPTEIPFRPFGATASNQHDVPRHLFRVFSSQTIGSNDTRWIMSLGASAGHLTDVFDENVPEIAFALNDHLRCERRSMSDPFLSWTSSLAVAIQYAIYKHKQEKISLSDVRLCIIDTTCFRRGTFVQDLELIDVVLRKASGNLFISDSDKASMEESLDGLANMRHLRGKKHGSLSGSFYFGEYLAQGQLCIESRSLVMTFDRIITEDLRTMIPVLEINLKRPEMSWENAVIQLREPFYDSEASRIITQDDFIAAWNISCVLPSQWIIMMFTNLLGLCPRQIESPKFASMLLDRLPDETLDMCFSQKTNFISSKHLPEVIQCCHLMTALSDKYSLKRYNALLESMYQTIYIIGQIRGNPHEIEETQQTLEHDTVLASRMQWLKELDEVCANDLKRQAMILRAELKYV